MLDLLARSFMIATWTEQSWLRGPMRPEPRRRAYRELPKEDVWFWRGRRSEPRL